MDLAPNSRSYRRNCAKNFKDLKKETGINKICLAGGVASLCSEWETARQKIFDNIWIQPASGDAGSALGAALVGWYYNLKKVRKINKNDSMKGTYLGCEFSNTEIISFLESINATYHSLQDGLLFKKLAELLDEGKVIGWFNGPMEFGPRALGEDQ